MLETFFARFNTQAQFYQWNEFEKLFALQSALVGPAGQLTWEIKEGATVKECK